MFRDSKIASLGPVLSSFNNFSLVRRSPPIVTKTKEKKLIKFELNSSLLQQVNYFKAFLNWMNFFTIKENVLRNPFRDTIDFKLVTSRQRDDLFMNLYDRTLGKLYSITGWGQERRG